MKKILVVDDSQALRESLVRWLEILGYEALQAGDAEEGKKVFDEHNPDLVLTDFEMPKGGGCEVLKYVKNRNSSIKIIIMTGGPNAETVQELVLMAGCDDFLEKPFNLADLAVKIKKLGIK